MYGGPLGWRGDPHPAQRPALEADAMARAALGDAMIENTDAEQIERLNARVSELLRERDALKTALKNVLLANSEFRAGMPEGWEGDPLQDACDVGHAALALLKDSANE